MAWREDVNFGNLTIDKNLKFNSLVYPASVTLTPAAGSSNVCNVTLTFKDADGVALTTITPFVVWLSDAATGAGLTGTAASGTPALTTGTEYMILTAKKSWIGSTNTSGVAVLEITDTSKTGYYVAVMCVNGGKVTVSSQLVTGDYG